jgi:hypothetical protein
MFINHDSIVVYTLIRKTEEATEWADLATSPGIDRSRCAPAEDGAGRRRPGMHGVWATGRSTEGNEARSTVSLRPLELWAQRRVLRVAPRGRERED